MTVDTRFYAPIGALTLERVADLTGAALAGDPELLITGVASAAAARPGEIAFLEGDGKVAPDVSGDLSAVFASSANRKHVGDEIAVLETPYPRHAHAIVANAMFRARHMLPENFGGAPIEPRVHPDAVIASGAVIGTGAVIGEGSFIGANAVIGPGVQIGRHCSVGANASLHCTLTGDHVTVLSGARMGEAGFGVIAGPKGAEDAPHFGRVILQDHSTVGANTCIDRGVFEDTIIGERTKIDNLCQIAHNVVLGRGVIVAAFGGISGSVTVGDGAMLGGRAGIADHVVVGERVSLAASSGVFRNIGPGETWGGTPAKPIRQWMREVAWLQKQASAKKSD